MNGRLFLAGPDADQATLLRNAGLLPEDALGRPWLAPLLHGYRLLEKSLAENGGKILEWSPARKTSLGGRGVPTISARLTMTDKVPLPMAATVYVFMHKERLYALGYFVPDSDRRFWERIANPMFGQLKWE